MDGQALLQHCERRVHACGVERIVLIEWAAQKVRDKAPNTMRCLGLQQEHERRLWIELWELSWERALPPRTKSVETPAVDGAWGVSVHTSPRAATPTAVALRHALIWYPNTVTVISIG